MIIKAGDAFFCNLVLMDELQLIYAIKFFAVVFWSAAGYSKILQMKKPWICALTLPETLHEVLWLGDPLKITTE
jgi:hypothetical protein